MDGDGTIYDVTLADGIQTEVRGSGYVQEGPLTTFFTSARRSTIGSLCERVASFRTADIRRVVRRDPQPVGALTFDPDGDPPPLEATR
jgi:hypothetical protein